MKKTRILMFILTFVLLYSVTAYAAPSTSTLPKIDRMTITEINQRIKTLGDINAKGSLIHACFDSIVIYKIKNMLDSENDVSASLAYYEVKLVNYEMELKELEARKAALTQ